MDFSIEFTSRRSNVLAREGLVATSQPLAAQAGLEILMGGGNAVDAAIATAATLCVVEPCMTGVGGDAFALIWIEADRTLFGLNASGPAGSGLSSEPLREAGLKHFPTFGGPAVTVPGSLRGWELALERFGSRPLDTLLSRPIRYAQEGFPVSERIAAVWQRSTDKMSRHPDSKRVWLPGGRSPRPGEIFKNQEFAHTLQVLVDKGIDAFYDGPIADQIVDCVQADDGFLTRDDLRGYRAEWVEPISTPYRNGFQFWEIPPNGQGLTALIALNLLGGFDLASLPILHPDRIHLQLEAIKLAFADAYTYIADPRCAAVPIDGLLSAAYADSRRPLIDLQHSLLPTPGNPSPHGDTIYLTVADSAGNMVSWIQSLYMGFGSDLTAGTTGVQLQNRGANFTLEKGHPNEAAPGKRPYHTIIPGFITRNGRAWSSFGVMGGFMQPQGHVQVGSYLVDFDLTSQAALDAPRFNWSSGRKVFLENNFGEALAAEMQRRGHEVAPAAAAAGHQYGGGQAIIRDPDTGVLIGGSEPRKDGCAVGF